MKAYSIVTFDVEPMTRKEAVDKGIVEGNIYDDNTPGYVVYSQTGIKIWCTEEVFRKHYLILNED